MTATDSAGEEQLFSPNSFTPRCDAASPPAIHRFEIRSLGLGQGWREMAVQGRRARAAAPLKGFGQQMGTGQCWQLMLFLLRSIEDLFLQQLMTDQKAQGC